MSARDLLDKTFLKRNFESPIAAGPDGHNPTMSDLTDRAIHKLVNKCLEKKLIVNNWKSSGFTPKPKKNPTVLDLLRSDQLY